MPIIDYLWVILLTSAMTYFLVIYAYYTSKPSIICHRFKPN